MKKIWKNFWFIAFVFFSSAILLKELAHITNNTAIGSSATKRSRPEQQKSGTITLENTTMKNYQANKLLVSLKSKRVKLQWQTQRLEMQANQVFFPSASLNLSSDQAVLTAFQRQISLFKNVRIASPTIGKIETSTLLFDLKTAQLKVPKSFRWQKSGFFLEGRALLYDANSQYFQIFSSEPNF